MKWLQNLFKPKITIKEHEKVITDITVIKENQMTKIEQSLNGTIALLMKDKQDLQSSIVNKEDEIKALNDKITTLLTDSRNNYSNNNEVNSNNGNVAFTQQKATTPLSPIQAKIWEIYSTLESKTESTIIINYNQDKPSDVALMTESNFRKNKSLMKSKGHLMNLQK